VSKVLRSKQSIAVALWLAALVLFWWVLRQVPLTAVFLSLLELTAGQIIVLVLLNGLVLALLTGRWWLILWGLGYKLPFGMTMGHRLAAFSVSYFTPGPQFGGEPVQVLLAEKVHGVPRITAVSSVALDKSLELLVNFAFLALGVLVILQTRLLGEDIGWQTAALALALLSFPVLYLLALWRGRRPAARFMRSIRPLFGRNNAWAEQFERGIHGMAASEVEAGRFFRHSPQVVLAALLISVAAWLVMIVEFGTMLTFLGAKVSSLEAIMVLTAVRFAFLLPLPGGLGTVEAALVLALTQLSRDNIALDPAIGVSTGVLIHSRDLLLSLAGLWWGNQFLTGLIDQSSQKEVSDDQFA
jgi:glycosyltransferase 2 family protein